ncbi:MAG: hypothetical protein AAGU75_11025 [Bacillota bacterium]
MKKKSFVIPVVLTIIAVITFSLVIASSMSNFHNSNEKIKENVKIEQREKDSNKNVVTEKDLFNIIGKTTKGALEILGGTYEEGEDPFDFSTGYLVYHGYNDRVFVYKSSKATTIGAIGCVGEVNIFGATNGMNYQELRSILGDGKLYSYDIFDAGEVQGVGYSLVYYYNEGIVSFDSQDKTGEDSVPIIFSKQNFLEQMEFLHYKEIDATKESKEND